MAEEEISQENYANWFALYQLCRLTKSKRNITISTIKFGEILGLSQQSGSRRINALIELNWIKRETDGKSQTISITKEGTNVMLTVYKNLKSLLESILIVGEVVEGMHEGGYYVAIQGYYDQFKEKLGFEPYIGTLNLLLTDTTNTILREKLQNISPVIIEGFKDQTHCWSCILNFLDGWYTKYRKQQLAQLELEKLKVLFGLLDTARETSDFATITELMVRRLENKFDFRPGFSNFREIVIEFLSGGYFPEQTGNASRLDMEYLHSRYKLTWENTRELHGELGRFHNFVIQ